MKHCLIFILCLFLGLNGVVAQTPTITSFNPTSGSHGTLVTITGTNLGNPTSFSIGGVSAIVISNTGTQLVGFVMPTSSTGAISITTTNGTATSSSSFAVTPNSYPAFQDGGKLVGTGAIGSASQGSSVSISSDGNTAIVGGYTDNNSVGAAWIYTYSGGVWSQQGGKLVGTGSIGASLQGYSVSISADGNTAIVGGNGDNAYTGAAWVYTRSGGIWTQQGSKLVGTGAIGAAAQSYSVSISADGNTAIVGGCTDNGNYGAAWVFTRSGGVWSQQGNKLLGTGATTNTEFGWYVSISADGNTAVVSAENDNSDVGAVWVSVRAGGVWMR
jgi:hypothetical protein